MSALPSYAFGTARFRASDLVRGVLLVPRNLVLALLSLYRAVISPLYGDVCRYYPSCSAYAVGAVQQNGALWGAVLSAWRVLRCNPWSAGGVDDVKPHAHFRYDLTQRGFVVPARKD
ncbi:membrane protein insertion efficiency factor YidD [Microbacterium sp. NPDC077391]|uniref:membrane protein insertion efficiency factor YidD n=1 Tax=Microbacterium sp. NPDC077391 TaxID=3154765 RepID=UPI003433A4D3